MIQLKYVDGLNYLDQLRDYVQTSLSSKQTIIVQSVVKSEDDQHYDNNEEFVDTPMISGIDEDTNRKRDKHGEQFKDVKQIGDTLLSSEITEENNKESENIESVDISEQISSDLKLEESEEGCTDIHANNPGKIILQLQEGVFYDKLGIKLDTQNPIKLIFGMDGCSFLLGQIGVC